MMHENYNPVLRTNVRDVSTNSNQEDWKTKFNENIACRNGHVHLCTCMENRKLLKQKTKNAKYDARK